MNKSNIQSIDLLQEMDLMSSNARKTILLIKGNLHFGIKNGVVKVSFDGDKNKSKRFLEGYKELRDKGLVKRVKKSHYMINPNALIPIDYEEAIQLWEDTE
jgi:hypothetical protein